MTIILFDNPELDNEIREKRERGYILLGGAFQGTDNEELWERVFFMEDEALAAGLLWERDSFIVSVREMGVTEKGKQFLTKGEYSSGLKPTFYVKPDMLQDLIGYLDKAPEAIDLLSTREAQHKKISEEEEENAEVTKEKKDGVGFPDEKHNQEVAPPIGTINKPRSGHERLTESPVDHHNGPQDQEKTSPSVIAIFSGVAALFVLGLAKVLVEDKHGRGSADYFFEPLLILIFVSVPIFVALRYIFKEGLDSSADRLKGLIFGAAVVLVLAWLVSLLDNGSSDCFYIIGCI